SVIAEPLASIRLRRYLLRVHLRTLFKRNFDDTAFVERFHPGFACQCDLIAFPSGRSVDQGPAANGIHPPLHLSVEGVCETGGKARMLVPERALVLPSQQSARVADARRTLIEHGLRRGLIAELDTHVT